MTTKKGIILAGGHGTRLHPLTSVISKQLLPVYDKPMIYYPLSTLMLGGIRDIAIITTERDSNLFQNLLGDGTSWGVKFTYLKQDAPNGLPEAFILAEEFINNQPCTLVLGDNIFFGMGLSNLVSSITSKDSGATIFLQQVTNPSDYGVATIKKDKVDLIEEKPKKVISDLAITGLYHVDKKATNIAKTLKKSSRGETEITDFLRKYNDNNELEYALLSRGFCWFDTGSFASLLEASNFVKAVTIRQGLLIGSPEEVAFRQGWITHSELIKLSKKYKNSFYGKQLLRL